MSNSDTAQRLWLTHKSQHNVKFSDVDEDSRRLEYFKDNQLLIESVNATENTTFTCAHNTLSHLVI